MNDGSRRPAEATGATGTAGATDSIDSAGSADALSRRRQQRQRGGDKRIGWITAGRLAAGRSAGPGGEQLHALLTAAATLPAPDEFDPDESGQLNAVLAAYRRATDSTTRTTRATAGAGPRAARLVLVKCAAVLFIIGGTGLAVASAGALPSPMQRFAHDYFGAMGVPAPSSSVAAASPWASGSPVGNSALSPSPQPSAAATSAANTQSAALCRTVAEDPQNWHAELSPSARTVLIDAAGGDQKVVSYCAVVVAATGHGGGGSSASPPAEPTGNASTAAEGGGQPTATHGNPHPSHSAPPGQPTGLPSPSPNSHGGGTTH